MQTYNASTQKFEKEQINAVPMFKIYGYMALALLITGAIAFGLPYLLVAIGAAGAYMPIIVVSAIVMLPMMLVIQFKAFNPNSKAVPICFFIYAVAMGCLLSSTFLAFEITDVALSFLVAGGTFGLMALFGGLTKKNLNGLLPLVFTAIIGSLILSLFNLFAFGAARETIYWVTEFVMFGAILLITAIDMNNIKRLALARGADNRNICLFCAFNLYVDFIYIFIRVLYFIGIARSNS